MSSEFWRVETVGEPYIAMPFLASWGAARNVANEFAVDERRPAIAIPPDGSNCRPIIIDPLGGVTLEERMEFLRGERSVCPHCETDHSKEADAVECYGGTLK